MGKHHTSGVTITIPGFEPTHIELSGDEEPDQVARKIADGCAGSARGGQMAGRPTIRDIVKSCRAEACESCGGPLPPWDDSPAGEHRPPWVNSDACSEACWRKAQGKSWPASEDCPGCPAHRSGPHKLGCRVGGARRLVVPGQPADAMRWDDSRPMRSPALWLPRWMGERFGAMMQRLGAELLEADGSPYEPPAADEATIAAQVEAYNKSVDESYTGAVITPGQRVYFLGN